MGDLFLLTRDIGVLYPSIYFITHAVYLVAGTAKIFVTVTVSGIELVSYNLPNAVFIFANSFILELASWLMLLRTITQLIVPFLHIFDGTTRQFHALCFDSRLVF